MNIKLAALTLILIILNFYSCGSKQTVSVSEIHNPRYAEAIEITETAEIPTPTRAQQVMETLMAAYPDRIEKVEFRDDDWALLLRGIVSGDTSNYVWYYYAQGRLLPQEKRENLTDYRSLSFYNYPAELPPWEDRTPEDTERFRNWTSNRRQGSTLRRSSYFLDDLWQATTRLQTENNLTRITFFGRQIRVHHLIREQLALVETRIRAIARTDAEVQAWINDIGTVEGWHWRNIANTQTRSYHSYGLAVDILPRSLGRRQTYWLWTSQYREDWWNVSYNERYHPPAAVVKAFEAYGFIWGGKWTLFDTMHFEYRPEILILNGLL